MRAPRVARLGLGYLGISTLLVGLTATIAPATFYDDFPFAAHWVDLLPPYNEHLVTDVGGLYLGFAVLFAWSAATLERSLARAVSLAWIVPAASPATVACWCATRGPSRCCGSCWKAATSRRSGAGPTSWPMR